MSIKIVPFSNPCSQSCSMFDFPVSPIMPRLFAKHFGMGLTSIRDDLAPSSRLNPEFYFRPRGLTTRQNVSDSEQNDSSKFQVKLDVNQFKPDEISVKTVNNVLVLHGKHEEKQNQNGQTYVSREFTRRYTLPEGIEPERVTSSLDHEGILTIEASKLKLEPPQTKVRVIPITRKEPLPNTIDQPHIPQ